VYQWPRLNENLQHEETTILSTLLAGVNDVPVWLPQGGSLQDAAETQRLLNEARPDVVIVASWGEIFKQAWLESLGILRIWNLHPSLLPAHRGPNPYAATILAGDVQSGVTLHRLVADVDAGEIIAQWPMDLAPQETSISLREHIGYGAYQLMQNLWHYQWREGGLSAVDALSTPQAEVGASLHRHHLVGQILLNWASPLPVLYRQSRACIAWAKPRLLLNNRLELTIKRLHVQPFEDCKHTLVWGHPASGAVVYVEAEALYWKTLQLPLPSSIACRLVKVLRCFPIGW
jgi:methionyl-tRNA formyltransferase